MCYGGEHTSCITIHLTNSILLHIHCCYKRISVHVTMKHLNNFTEGNLTTLFGFEVQHWSTSSSKATLDDQKKTTLLLVNPHCSVPGHYCHCSAESEQSLHGLPLLPTKVEWCPTASEGDTMESDGTDISTSSVPHELVYIRTCADNKRGVT